jgi:hypothetical protein
MKVLAFISSLRTSGCRSAQRGLGPDSQIDAWNDERFCHELNWVSRCGRTSKKMSIFRRDAAAGGCFIIRAHVPTKTSYHKGESIAKRPSWYPKMEKYSIVMRKVVGIRRTGDGV